MQEKIIYTLTKENLSGLPISPKKGERIFLRGDLGSGKTTLSRHIISSLLGTQTPVKSPTYIYYNRYGENIYHFDLYRLQSYDDFVNIGGEEILDNLENICLIEWPELLAERYEPTIDIEILKTEKEDERKLGIALFHSRLS
ncbi:MAG: tRNA (adenosine(37)-N6)-threonylcarbamoyltransferase complex ATPase subunit type 1 TsaE [Candidatus Gracilibacteria bacterium]|nr:tRNA (adenosine(37)-N6)-threonylcarbamoyltransferase complex ATPase subunit type 1 TsaE [Candidatus Gracilibacteria bacterium]